MPIGYGGYFDMDAALAELEKAMMAQGQVTAQANRTTLPQMLGQLGQSFGQGMGLRNQLQQQDWQRGMREQELEQRGQYYDYLMQPEPPKQPNIKDILSRMIFEGQELSSQQKALAEGIGLLDAPDTKTLKPTDEERRWRNEIGRHRRAIGQEEQATGVPQSPEAIRQMAWDKAYGQKYGEEEPEEAEIPSAPSIAALNKMIEDTENAGEKRNLQMFKSKLMRAQFEEQGIPYDTSEEDNLLEVLRGKNVDWPKAEAENPNLDWGYIWEQLGTK